LKVSLFIPCMVEQFLPQVGEATARVLARAGATVEYPRDQTCCGQMLFKAGRWREARTVARHFIEVFARPQPVVAPSGSCVGMVRNYFPHLLREDARWHERAVALGGRIYELTEYLVRVLKVDDLGASWAGRAAYHDSCQVLRSLGISREPRALLSHVRGLEILEMAGSEKCCGFGGSFTLQFPAISEAMVEEKASMVLATGAQFLISAEIGCLMNIGGYFQKHGQPVRAVHIAEVLASSYEKI
jgi:L-lactate dehydrogenase complex protein LldE